jgi:hypothetical protein
VGELWQWIESSELAFQIGATWWFPLLESLHVLGFVTLLGSLLMIDLRLMGVAGRSYTVEAMTSGMLIWAWLGFAVALITGAGMFVSRPTHYAANPAFQIKLLFLVAAGINLILFRSVRWTSGRFAGATSLVIWVGVVIAGRWTGHIN